MRLGVAPVIVTFEADAMARRYVQDTGLTWPLLVDRDRALYTAYGMDRAPWWAVWGFRTMGAYAKALVAGHRLRWPHDDVSQRGGDVLVDPDGIIRLHHVGDGPGDRPGVDVLLEIVQRGAAPR